MTPRHDSPKRKRRSAVTSTSCISIDCDQRAFSNVTANCLKSGVHHIAASEANSIVSVDCVAGPPLPVLDQGQFHPGSNGLVFTLRS